MKSSPVNRKSVVSDRESALSRFRRWATFARLVTTILLGGFVLSGAESLAVNLYWDTNGAATGSADSTSGVWGTSNFWNTDAAGLSGGTFQIGTAGSDTVFISAGNNATGANTITISGTQSAAGIVVSNGTVTLSGTSTPVLMLGGGGLTMDSTLDGNFTLSSALANIVLSGTQTWANNTSTRLLSVSSPSVHGAASGGSTNVWTVGGVGGGSIVISGVVDNGGNGGALAFNKAGHNNLVTLSGSNIYTGATTIVEGTLALDFTTAPANAINRISPSSTLNLGSGISDSGYWPHPTLKVTGSAGQTNGQTFPITYIGSGHNAQITAGTASTGTVTINLGTINAGPQSTLNITNPTTSSGTISATNGNDPTGIIGTWLTTSVSGTQGSDWVINSGSGTLVPYTGYSVYGGSGNITSGVNHLTVNTQTVSGTISTAAGITDVNSIRFTGTAATSMALGGTLRLGGAGAIFWSDATQFANLLTVSGGNLTAGGTANTSGQIHFIINSSGTTGTAGPTVSSAIANNGSGVVSLLKSGVGGVTLSGSNTYSGGTTISGGGRITVNTSTALGTGPVSVNAGAQLWPNGASLSNDLSLAGIGTTENLAFGVLKLSGAASTSGTITLTETARIGASAAGTFSLNGKIIGPGTLELAGGVSGVVFSLFSSLNDWAGDLGINNTAASGKNAAISNFGVTVKLGSASVNIPNGVGKGNVILAGGTTAAVNSVFDLNGFGETINGLVSAGSSAQVLVTNSGGLAATLSVGDNNATADFGGTIANGGSASVALTKIGLGTQTLSGSNTYTGITNVNSGTLQLGNGVTDGSIANSSAINNSGVLSFNLQGTHLYGMPISGGGALVKNGPGFLTLTGTNIFTGGIAINGGSLFVRPGALPDSGSVYIGAGAYLAFDQFSNNFTFNNLTITGPGAGNVVTLNGANVNWVGGSILAPTASLQWDANPGAGGVQTGSGTWSLSGSNWLNSNNFNGSWQNSGSGVAAFSNAGSGVLGGTLNVAGTVNAGVLQFQTGTNYSLVGGTIALTGSNGFVDVQNIARIDSNLAGTNGLTKAGSGVLVLGGQGTYQGATNIQAGVLQYVDGATPATGALLVGPGATLEVNNNGAFTVTSAISGSGNLVKNGNGTLTLSGTNTYTGGATVHGGTLRVFPGALPNSGNVTVDAGAGLFFDGLSGDVTLNNVMISGSGAISASGGFNVYWNGGSTAAVTPDLKWDADSVAGGAQVGSGTWALSGSNWINSGNVNVNWVNTGTGVAVFANSGSGVVGGTINVNGTINAGGIRFQTGTNYSLVGGTLALTGSNGLVDATGFGRIDSILAGTNGLTKGGTGVLVLGGQGTYQGATNIQAGTLQYVDGATPATGALLVNGGASLDFNNNASMVVAAAISGSGGVSKNGTGTLLLSGTNTYSSPLFVNAGTLLFGSGGTPGSGSLELAAGALLKFDNNGAISVNVTIEGAGNLAKAGSGALYLNAPNYYTGSTTILGGSVSLSSAGTFASSSISIAGGSSLDFSNSSALTIPGNISGPGALLKIGAGQLTLTGSNTYTGGTNVNAGLLVVSPSALPGTGTVNVTNSGSLVITGMAANLTLNNVVTSNGGQVVGSNGFNVTWSNGSTAAPTSDLRWDADFATAGVQTGSGTWSLSGSNWLNSNNLNGSWVNSGTGLAAFLNSGSGILGGTLNVAGTINVATIQFGPGTDYSLVGGTLALTGSNGLVDVQYTARIDSTLAGTNGLTKAGGGGLVLGGQGTYLGATNIQGGVLRYVDGSVPANGALLVGPGATLEFDNNGAFTVNSAISGSGNLVKYGNGTVTLTGTNTYTGGVSVHGGTLRVFPGALPNSGNVALDPGSNLFFDGLAGDLTLNNVTISGSGVISASGGHNVFWNGGTTAAVTPDLKWDADSVTGGAQIGSGTWALSGSNWINSNNVNVNWVNSGSGFAVFANSGSGVVGGTLNVNGTINVGGIQFGDGTNYSLVGGTIALVNNTPVIEAMGIGRIDSRIAGTNGLTKAGTGILVLGGQGTYQGATNIQLGVLQYTDGAVPATGSLIVNGGASLEFNNNAYLQVVAAISGSGSMAKFGAGPLVLQGSNSYTGPLNIQAGTLRFENGGIPGGGALTVAGGAQLQFDNNANIFVNATISGSGTLTKAGTGGLYLQGAAPYTGFTSIQAGTLIFSNPVATSGVGVNAGALLVFDSASPSAFAGIISGSGAVVKSGNGILTLTGSNTYAGGTTVNGGSLIVNPGALPGSGSVNVTNGAILTFAGMTADLNLGNLVTSNGGWVIASGGFNVIWANGSTAGLTPELKWDSAPGTGGLQAGPGTWALSGSNWINSNNVNQDWVNTGKVAIFGTGGAGTVSAGDSSYYNVVLPGAINADVVRYMSAGTAGYWLSGTAGTLNVTSGTIEVTASSAYMGVVLNGTSGLAKTGPGTLHLVGSNGAAAPSVVNVYAGPTRVMQGALQVTAFGNIPTNSPIQIDGGAFLNWAVAAGSPTSVPNIISGPGSLKKLGLGTLVLTGTNAYQGETQVAAGILAFGNGGTPGTGPFSLSSGAQLRFDTADEIFVLGAISGSGSLTKAGSGILNLAGSNTYTGGTNVNAGVLKVLPGGLANAGTVNVAVGATLAFDGLMGDLTLNNVTITGLGSVVSLNGYRVFWNGGATPAAGANLTWDADANTAGVQTGNGVWDLSTPNWFNSNNVNQVWTNSGLENAVFSADAMNGQNIMLSGSAVLRVNEIRFTVDPNFNGRYLLGGSIELSGSNGSISVAGSGDIGSVLSGTNGLTKSGPGNFYLSGQNIYSGITRIMSGLLAIHDGGRPGNGPVVMDAGAYFYFEMSTNASFANSISGAGFVGRSGGSNTITLTGSNSWTGGTNVNGGTFRFVGVNAVPPSGTINVGVGATLVFDGLMGDTDFPGVTITGAGTVISSNPMIRVSWNGGSTIISSGPQLTWDSNPDQPGVQVRAGTWSLAGSNWLGGNGNQGWPNTGNEVAVFPMDTIGGNISVSGSSSLRANGLVFLSGTNTFRYLLGGSLTLTGSNAFIDAEGNAYIQSVLLGNNGFTKSGSAILALGGANTYLGETHIQAGTLVFQDGGMPGSGPLVIDGGLLQFHNLTDIAIASPIAGPGRFAKSGSGTLLLTGTNSWTGDTTVLAGTLKGAPNALPNLGNLQLAAGAVLAVDVPAGLTANLAMLTISGSGRVLASTPDSTIQWANGSLGHLNAGTFLVDAGANSGFSQDINGLVPVGSSLDQTRSWSIAPTANQPVGVDLTPSSGFLTLPLNPAVGLKPVGVKVMDANGNTLTGVVSLNIINVGSLASVNVHRGGSVDTGVILPELLGVNNAVNWRFTGGQNLPGWIWG